MSNVSPSLATEVSGVPGGQGHPVVRFGVRERQLLASVKAYVDANSNTSLAQYSVLVGNASGLEAAVDTTLSTSSSRIAARSYSFTATNTNASPAVFTATAHGLQNGDCVTLSVSGGSLSANFAAATPYFVVSKAANTFQLSATWGGAAINAGGAQTGTQTVTASGLAPAPASIGTTDIAAAAGILGSQLSASAGIVGTQLASNAAVALSQLANLTSGQIVVGSAGNVPTAVAMSGDVAIVASGATTIQAGSVTGSKIASTTVAGSNMVANTVDFAQLALDVSAQSATVTLTQSQVQNLNGTPIQVIAGPGAGKVLIIDEIQVENLFNTSAFAGGGFLQFKYHASTVIAAVAASVITSASTNNWIFEPSFYQVDASTGTAPFAALAQANVALDVTNATGAFTGGNAASQIKIIVRYHVATLLA